MGFRENYMAEEVAYEAIGDMLRARQFFAADVDGILAEVCAVDNDSARHAADKATARVIAETAKEINESISAAVSALREARGLSVNEAVVLMARAWNAEN